MIHEHTDRADLDTNLAAGANHRCGVRAKPTPAGVPVAITSPGCSVVNIEQYETIASTSWIIRLVDACCTISPSTVVVSVSVLGSGISSVVTIHGPQAPDRSKFLPGVNWLVWRCQSPSVPSMKHE